MKRNKYEPVLEATLDLHGVFSHELEQSLSSFITESRNQKKKRVLIITGKGLRSSDGPVLKPLVQGFLRDQHLSFRDAKIQEGGSGALVVSL